MDSRRDVEKKFARKNGEIEKVIIHHLPLLSLGSICHECGAGWGERWKWELLYFLGHISKIKGN